MFMQNCPLCKSEAFEFCTIKERVFYSCSVCKGVFVDKNALPSKESERSRYLSHNNDINDSHYQSFVNPIVDSVLTDFSSDHIGLDFGAGPGPVISKLLNDRGLNTKLFDPFFHNNPELLRRKYDYIICCEVMEHFYNPRKEFILLKELLRNNGKIYCMTAIYDDSIDFKSWHYKNDKTHVFFYKKETLEYIYKEFNFLDLRIADNLIVFSLK